MNKEFAMKWADALESGKYKQTKGKLFDGEGYCCLGVACVLAGLKFEYVNTISCNNNLPWKIINNSYDSYDYNDISLPQSLVKDLEMYSPSGVLRENDENKHSLTQQNDEGKTFHEIAKFIRENYELL